MELEIYLSKSTKICPLLAVLNTALIEVNFMSVNFFLNGGGSALHWCETFSHLFSLPRL